MKTTRFVSYGLLPVLVLALVVTSAGPQPEKDVSGETPVITIKPGTPLPADPAVPVRESGPASTLAEELQYAAAPTTIENEERERLLERNISVDEIGVTSLRLRLLSEKLRLPLNELENMDHLALRRLFEANARRLQVNIYEWDAQKEKHVLKVRGTSNGDDNGGTFISPLPTPTPAQEIKASLISFTRSDDLLQTFTSPLSTPGPLIPRIFLPLVLNMPPAPPPLPAPALDRATVEARIWNAYTWWFGLWRDSADPNAPGFVKEYPGFPLWMENLSRLGDPSYPRMIGHYMNGSYSNKFGYIEWFAVNAYYDFMDVRLEEAYDWNYGLLAIADRSYTPTGQTTYNVCYLQYDQAENVNVYLGETLMFNTITTPKGTCSQRTFEGGGKLPAHRYTVKHGQQMARNAYHAIGNHYRSPRAGKTGDNLGYPWDLYDPIYGLGANRPDDYVFHNATYYDCDLVTGWGGINNPHPWGVNQYNGIKYFTYYGYESKVCLDRTAYILVSRADYLATALQAIHILNKYGNPDYYYANPNIFNGLGVNITPRMMARWLESKWNGYGLPAYLKDPTYASGVRTNVFLVLETILGYKFGDEISRDYADQTALVLLSVQCGSAPYPNYLCETQDDGYVVRPNYHGAALAGWRAGGSYPYAMPPRTFIQDILDILGMPHEVEGVALSNAETTLSYEQALRVYNYFRWGFTRGTDPLNMIPRRDIRLYGGKNAIALHVTEARTAAFLLQEIRNQGGTAYKVETYDDGYYYYCNWLNESSCAAGTNFSITPGRGIIVWTSSASTYRPSGTGIGASVGIALQGGYFSEFIGVPYVTSNNRRWFNTKQLHERLTQNGCGSRNLYRYNSGTESWVLVSDTENYEFLPTEALRVAVQNSCTLTP